MGKKGSEVAKESADLILTDDNFTSIEAAVREGRTVYDNLKKVISWTLPTNAGETITIIVASNSDAQLNKKACQMIVPMKKQFTRFFNGLKHKIKTGILV